MDKHHAFELGLAFGRGLLFTKQTGAESLATDALEWITLKLAQDTKEDGFVTLTDKSGKPYVAQLEESEKERYKETGKKLSQVKKEEKENKGKKAEKESEEQRKEKIKNNLLAAGGKIWDGGEKGKRIYLNLVYKKILPVMTDYVPLTKNFSHDNYSYFYYNGDRYSPQDVKWFYGIINKAYYDVDTGKFVNAGVFSDEFEERAKNYEPKPKAPEFKPKTMEELKPYLKDWKGKLYKYGDGTKAIFSNGQKIILTPEQFEALVPLAKR